MATAQIPTGITAGSPGSLWSAPVDISLDGSATYVVPAGDWLLYNTNNDIDLEVVTATTPTWTKMRDGTATEGYFFASDGASVRLKNTGVTAAQVGTLIQIGGDGAET